MSGGRAATHEDGTLVRLRTDEGLVGWGEVTTLGRTYLPDLPAGPSAPALADLAPGPARLDPTRSGGVNRAWTPCCSGSRTPRAPSTSPAGTSLGQAAGGRSPTCSAGCCQAACRSTRRCRWAPPEAMAEFVRGAGRRASNGSSSRSATSRATDVARTRACVEARRREHRRRRRRERRLGPASARRRRPGVADLPVFVEQPCRDDRRLGARPPAARRCRSSSTSRSRP